MNTTTDRQLIAMPELRETIDFQGRRYDWIARMIGVSRFQLSHVLASRRALDENRAARLAAILGVPLFFAFKVPDGNNMIPSPSEQEVVST